MRPALQVLAWLFVLGCLAGLTLLWAHGVIGLAYTKPGALSLQPAAALELAPEEPVHVLIVGTSLTTRGTWVGELEAELAACRKGPVKVEALAKAGATIRWGWPAFEARMAGAQRPDLIAMEFSGNDAVPWRGLPLFMAKARTQKVIDLAKSKDIPLYLATMSPGWGVNALKRPGQHRYHAMYRDLAARNGLGLIDTMPIWLGLSDAERAQLVPDDLHPTEAAMRQITLSAFATTLGVPLCD